MLLFQLDWPALLAGCGPPESDGKSLLRVLVRFLRASTHDNSCGAAIASSYGSRADHEGE